MSAPSVFSRAKHYQPRQALDYQGAGLAAWFGDPLVEYEAARQRAALFDRGDRGLIVAAGRDRQSWLHNLVTNAIKTLRPGEGAYAFATDVKGRVQFDLNVLALADELWLDVDRRAVEVALAHLNRYLISEDVKLRDATGEHGRLGVIGPRNGEIAARLGAEDLAALRPLASRRLNDGGALLVRNDLGGLPAFELIVPVGAAGEWWDKLFDACGAAPAGFHTLDALRIEEGIPWFGRDIDNRVLPPETGLIDQGICYDKGCYLGQEVLERMRSRGSLARRLVRIAVTDGEAIALPAAIRRDGADVGRVTSLVRHPLRDEWIGLAYLKTSLPETTELTIGDAARPVRVLS